VRAIILTINVDKERISFGLKPSYFVDDDFEMIDAEPASHEEEEAVIVKDHEIVQPSESEDDDVEVSLEIKLFLAPLTKGIIGDPSG